MLIQAYGSDGGSESGLSECPSDRGETGDRGGGDRLTGDRVEGDLCTGDLCTGDRGTRCLPYQLSCVGIGGYVIWPSPFSTVIWGWGQLSLRVCVCTDCVLILRMFCM